MIRIENLNKVFRTEEVETTALNNVSIHIKRENLLPSWDLPGVVNLLY